MKRVQSIESLERRTYFSPLVLSQPVPFATGSNPSALVTADLTGNGVTDVVTSDFGSANIAVLRGNGNGNGTFQPPVFYPVGSSPEALAVGDFNGDGIPDLVTANEGSNTISVLLGRGDGTFLPQVTYAVGVRPQSIAVADFAGNGRLDIVTANEGSNTVSVLMNNGDGTFGPQTTYFTGDEPDGVAVGDFNGDSRPDIVTVNPLNNNIHILLNSGDGGFGKIETYVSGLAARAVTVADINSDGRPDIITSNIGSTNISVFDGVGDGTFADQQNFSTGAFPFAVAVADLNGDGRPDIITANNFDNNIGVLIHQPVGTFGTSRPFRAGTGPVAVAAADVNGDGKADVLVADFNTSTVSVLTNQTVFVPLIPTAITLTPGQNPVQVKNRLKLSVQVTPAAAGAKKPVGVVQFFDGDRVIGIGTLSATGVATIYTRSLVLGSHTITAHYQGDGIYAASLSAAVTETVVSADQTSPLVLPSISSVRLPSSYVAGDRGIVNLSINDIGDGVARGTVQVQLYASLSSTFDSTAFSIPVNGNANASFALAGGASKVVPVGFTVPANLQAGNYTFFAALAPVSGLALAQVITVPAAGVTASNSVLQFGAVGTHRGYRLTRTLSGGNSVTLSLTGPGTGTLTENSDGGISLAVSGTTYGSNLSVVSAGVTLDALSDPSPIGSILAPTATATGHVSLSVGARRVTLGGASGANILLAGGPANTLSLGGVSATTLYSAAPIQSLTVASYSDTPSDSITTAWIGSLKSAGDFGASLTLNGGAGGRYIGLKSASIGGALLNSTWSIQANVASVKVAGVDAGFSGSIHGNLSSFIDSGDFAGNLAARNITTLRIGGNLSGADVFAGANFGADARLGNNNDVFASGILSSIVISGSVSNSFVAAGLLPIDDNPLLAGATLLRRSAIAGISIGQGIDSSSRFVSAGLPSKVRVGGAVIATAGDANFSLPF